MKQFNIINEDGTSINNFPKNPLEEKWKKEFPKPEICKELEEKKIVNYSCLDCSKCPNGDLFEIPNEDKKVYKKYMLTIKEYNKMHNNF